MTPSPTRLLLALACCLAASPAMAAKVNKVEVKGLADPAMQDNVRTALSLSDELDKDISARRLNYLLRQAEAETREALEPFGYYSPTIVIRRSDRDRPVGAGNGNANRDVANDAAGNATTDADALADTATDMASTAPAVDDNDNDNDNRGDTPVAAQLRHALATATAATTDARSTSSSKSTWASRSEYASTRLAWTARRRPTGP
jgi:hypothetical protein